MKKEFGFIFIVLIFLICSNFVLASLVSNNPTLNLGDDKDKPIVITEKQDIGGLIGFDQISDTSVENVQYKQTSEGVEITLKQGGKITFSPNPNNFYFSNIDAKYYDLTKPNKFVFKDGKLVSADFTLKNGERLLGIVFNGINFQSPTGAHITLSNGALEINVIKGSKDLIARPYGIGLKYDKSMSIAYYSKGEEMILELWGEGKNKFSSILKEGKINFLSVDSGEIVFLGEKVVLGDIKNFGYANSDRILSNMEIKNANPNVGTSLFFENYQDIETKNPYMILNSVSSIGLGCAVAPGCPEGGDGRIVQYSLSIFPDKEGDMPQLTFKEGNPILPSMTSGQFVNINPGDKKMSLVTDFNSQEDESEKIQTSLTFFSDKSEINNGGDIFKIKKDDTRYNWYSSTNINSQNVNAYPLKLQNALEKSNPVGTLTIYGDIYSVGDSNSLIVAKRFSAEGESMKSKIFWHTTVPDYLYSVANVIGKVFGDEAGQKTFEKLLDIFNIKTIAP